MPTLNRSTPLLDYIGLSSLLATRLELDTADADFITLETQWLFSAVDHLLGICENKTDRNQPIPVAIPAEAETLPHANNRLLPEPTNPILFEDTLDHLRRIETSWQLKVKRELTSYANRLNSAWRSLQLSIKREGQLGEAGQADPALQAQINMALVNLLDAMQDMAVLMQHAFGILVTGPAQLRQVITQF